MFTNKTTTIKTNANEITGSHFVKEPTDFSKFSRFGRVPTAIIDGFAGAPSKSG